MTKIDFVNGQEPALSAENLNQMQSNIELFSIPTGGIVQFATETPPTGWLICDGSAISRTTYSDLFSVIGSTYGDGDGNTTFNLPNFKGKVAVGIDNNDTDFNALGKTGGTKNVTLTIDQIPPHQHLMPSTAQFGHPGNVNFGASGDWKGADYLTGSKGGGQPHTNLQPYISINYIIKT